MVTTFQDFARNGRTPRAVKHAALEETIVSDRLIPEQRGENQRLTAERFHYLARVSSELEWMDLVQIASVAEIFLIDMDTLSI
jgi:hypothetical protein